MSDLPVGQAAVTCREPPGANTEGWVTISRPGGAMAHTAVALTLQLAVVPSDGSPAPTTSPAPTVTLVAFGMKSSSTTEPGAPASSYPAPTTCRPGGHDTVIDLYTVELNAVCPDTYVS